MRCSHPRVGPVIGPLACLLIYAACAARNSGSAPFVAQPPAADAGPASALAATSPNDAAAPSASAGLDGAPARATAGSHQAQTWPSAERTAFGAAVEKAVPAVIKFAPASGREAAIAAGDVLTALADAVEALPDPNGRAREHLIEIRFEAKRLRRSDRMAFSLPKWIKLGLVAAIDSLQALAPGSEAARYWFAMARQAQQAVNAGSSMAFQHSALQDAMRTTISAFVVVGQAGAVCH
jgi:hypothetical protein